MAGAYVERKDDKLGPSKQCPFCHMFVSNFAKECPNCHIVFQIRFRPERHAKKDN